MAVATIVSNVCGWIAIKGMDRDRILETLSLAEAPDAPKPKASIFALPNGWSVLFTVDFGYPTPERMALLSAEGIAIAVSADERTMFSVIRRYEGGQAVFAIEHDGGGQGVRHVAVAGKVPVEWDDILADANREQDEKDREGAEVDYLFEAPMALADVLCGYRQDTPWPDGQKPESILLMQKKSPGLIGRLFGNRA